MISLAAISAASLGLKPRITSPLGTGNEAVGIEGRAGLVCSTIMSLKLGRGESVAEQAQPVSCLSDTHVSDLIAILGQIE